MLLLKITATEDPSFHREMTISASARIGRADECEILLPDPKKHISRTHAVISPRDDSYMITAKSGINPLYINGNTYQAGESVKLAVGDKIAVHGYIIFVSKISEPAPPPIAPSLVSNSFAGKSSHEDTFGGVFGSPPNPSTQPTATQAWPDETKPAIETPTQHGLSDSVPLDPLKLLGTTSSSPDIAHWPTNLAEQPVTPTQPVLVDLNLHRSTKDESYISHLEPTGAATTTQSLATDAAPPQIQTKTAESADDIFAALGTFIGRVPGYTPPAPAPSPSVILEQPPVIPPTVEKLAEKPAVTVDLDSTRGMPAVGMEAVNNRADYVSDNMTTCLQAFRRGARLPDANMTEEQAIRFMESAGHMTRVMVESLLSLLASRGLSKGAMGSEEYTMIAPRENNPLKIMRDADEVLRFLMDGQIPHPQAYLSPEQSVQQACDDLNFHEAATTLGIRAVIEGSIRHFSPQQVEIEFDNAGKKVVLNRKANLWETYVNRYQTIESTMQDSISQLYEQDFRKTYDEHIRKLKAQSRAKY